MKTIAHWLEFRFNLFHVPFEDFGNTKLSHCHLRTSFNEMFHWVKMPPKLVKSADRDQNIIRWSGYSSIWYFRPFPHAFSRKYPKILNLTRFTRFLAATKQLYEWFSPSVCLSVCLWRLFHYVPIMMKFSGVISNDKSDVHAKGQGQRSKVKVTEVKTQLNRFRTVTPVWIHIWRWNDAHSLMLLRRGALLFFKVIRQISRSHGSNNRWIWPKLGVSGL